MATVLTPIAPLLVQHVKEQVLKIAAAHDLDSATFMLAIADTVATVAAVLDRRDDTVSLQDRLDVFCKRVEETYRTMRNQREH